MPYELFWHGKLDAFYIYQDKAQIEFERKQKEIDGNAWLNGLYTKKALESVYHLFNGFADKNCKKEPYPDKPILLKQQEDDRKTEEDKNILLYKRLKAWSAGVKPKQ